MPDKSKPSETAGSRPTAPVDRWVDQAVVDLHIARRIVLIYPASHDQVKQSLARVYNRLTAILAREPSMTLTVQKEGLAQGNRVLGTNTAVISDLAGVLRQYQIATLTFSKGLEAKELFSFLRLIASEREKVQAQGGVDAVVAKMALPHIRIQTVDYSKLQMTEEREIQRSSRREQDGSIWQSFVANLLAEENQLQHGLSASIGSNLKPAELADMLNRNILDSGSAVNQYKKVVGADTGDFSGQTEISEGLEYFQHMIKGLNPELKKQFLSATFEYCTQTDTISSTARLIDGLGGDLIVHMLRQASSEGRQISPSLMAFINKIGHLNLTGASPGVAGTGAQPEGLSSHKIESLLAHEQYDTYVDSGYGKLLADLARNQPQAAVESETRDWLQEIESELDDACINAHVGRSMSRLMQSCADVGDYRDWARQLAYLLDDLLETRAFEYLIELMAFVRREHQGADPERSQIAGLLLDRFSEPQFVAKAIEVVDKSMQAPTPEALDFFMELGEPVVLEILDGMDPSHTFHDDGILTHILSHLSGLTAQEALARVKDNRPDYVRRMLRIIRKMGDSESAQQVRVLMDHADFDVRMEALATLLKFRNKWGLIRLRELLDQPLETGFMTALRLAGDYRIRDVVPELLAIVEQRRDLEQREAALRALGRIGDALAVPTLTKLAHRRWSISKKQIDRLKQVLYETLGGYPMGDVKELLHFGLKQKDAAIQAACRKLLREGTRADARGDSKPQ